MKVTAQIRHAIGALLVAAAIAAPAASLPNTSTVSAHAAMGLSCTPYCVMAPVISASVWRWGNLSLIVKGNDFTPGGLVHVYYTNAKSLVPLAMNEVTASPTGTISDYFTFRESCFTDPVNVVALDTKTSRWSIKLNNIVPGCQNPS